MTPATAEKQNRPYSRQVLEALDHFGHIGQQFQHHYKLLAGQVLKLTDEIEESHAAMRRNLIEKDKMQAVLISSLQSLTIGVLAIGQDGIVIVANPTACRLVNRPLDKVAAHHIEQVMPTMEDRDELIRTLQGTGGVERQTMWCISGGYGEDRQIEVSAIRAMEPYDQHVAGLILFEDVSELKSLETRSALKNRLTGMGEIAMNLAHEIRNPLGSIALLASTLDRELAGNPELAELSHQIVSGVKSLEHLVANTLEFAKPRRMRLTQVDLVELLRETLNFVEHPLREKSITVEFDHDMLGQAWIAGDPEQLRQVFLNLMINAIQAMLDEGTLTLRVNASSDGGWEVVIQDDGIGIPAELVNRIFDPFFTTKDKGSGIGLAIVHNILMAHHGRIAVKSREAAGTSMTVKFPSSQAVVQAMTAMPCEVMIDE